jgi:outer membrane lipase/esterase
MAIFKSALRACVLATVVVLAQGEAAAQFNQFYYFGDSLTDAGSFKPVLPPGTGLFTTNPGPIWAQVLAQRYGSTATPANQGGNDYAEGGARVSQLPGVPASPPTGTATPITQQISNFIAKGQVNHGALYSVWGGADDVFYQLGLLAAGAISPSQAQANLALAATQLGGAVGVLNAAGARYILLFNLPDIGSTPFGKGSGQSSSITALTNLYNSTLFATVDALNLHPIRLNIFGLFNEAIANPSAFGLTNVTSQGCTTASLLCTSSTLVAPNVPQTYLFADDVHPTTIGHQVIADYVASVITAPQEIGLLAEAPLTAEQANFRALDDRMWSALSSPRPTSKYEAYAVYDYGNYDRSGDFGGGSSDTNTIVVGGDSKISEQLLAGIAFGYTQDKSKLGGSGGGFTLNDAMLTFYLGYGSGPWYVGATVGGGGLDYRNVRRTFALGPANRTESGSTNGTQVVGRLLGGYWFNTSQEFIHGPYARLTYQNIKVDGYGESGTSSTAMSFGDQKQDTFSSSVGWQASGVLGSIRPFGRVSWEYADNGNRDITASLVSLPGTFTLPAFNPKMNYALFLVGASMPLGKDITGFLSVNASAGNSAGNYQAVTVGIRAPL